MQLFRISSVSRNAFLLSYRTSRSRYKSTSRKRSNDSALACRGPIQYSRTFLQQPTAWSIPNVTRRYDGTCAIRSQTCHGAWMVTSSTRDSKASRLYLVGSDDEASTTSSTSLAKASKKEESMPGRMNRCRKPLLETRVPVSADGETASLCWGLLAAAITALLARFATPVWLWRWAFAIATSPSCVRAVG